MRDETSYPLAGASTALAVACLANFIPNFAQYQASHFGSVIMERFGIEPGQFSLLFSSPMIPAIFLALVAGILIDKFGAKQVVGIGMAVICAEIFADDFMDALSGQGERVWRIGTVRKSEQGSKAAGQVIYE